VPERPSIAPDVEILLRPQSLEQHVQVFVRDNNVDQALRILKRKMQREGVFREMRRRRFYEKPSDRATREKAEAKRRSRKLARKQAIRDGLIVAPIKKSADSRTSRTELRADVAKTARDQPGIAVFGSDKPRLVGSTSEHLR
jgi:small subunit ribosomal protein S21